MLTMTLEQIAKVQREGLQALIEKAGSIAHLGRMIDVPDGVVRSWYSRGRVSREGALAVAGHPTLGPLFPVTKLRPDIKA